MAGSTNPIEPPCGVILEAFPAQACPGTRITLQAEVLKGNGALPQSKTTRVIFGPEGVEPEIVSWAPPYLYIIVVVPAVSPAPYDLGLTFLPGEDRCSAISFAACRPYTILPAPHDRVQQSPQLSSSASFEVGENHPSGPASVAETLSSFTLDDTLGNAGLIVQDDDADASSTVSFPDSSSQTWPWDEHATPVPDNEVERHKELLSYRILDVEEEHMFDRLTKLAKMLFNVPIALISLLDTERQWFLSHEGLDARETPRCMAFCAFAIMKDEVFEVSNAFRDPRFAQNPLVQGAPDVVFYAGAPLMTQNGFKLGTFCIIDHKPKKALNEEQKIALHALAALTVQAMDMRRKNVCVNRSRHRLSRIARNVTVEREVFFQALDLVDQGVLVLSGKKNFEISYVNRQMEGQTGYRLGQLLGQSITCLQGENTKPRDAERVRHILADNAEAEIEITHHQPNGDTFQHVLTFSPGWYRQKSDKDSTGTPVGSRFSAGSVDASVNTNGDGKGPAKAGAQRGGRPDFWLVVSASGNTDEATLTRKLKREVQRTQDASVAKSRFLANMSHELRTPLNAVVGCAQILSESKTLSEADHEIVGHVTSASNVLLELIGDILDLSRVEIDAQDLVMAPFSVWEVAESIRDVFSSKATQARLDFEVSVDDNMPSLVITDANRFKQILVNLAGNALKFTTEGSVRIRFSFAGEGDDVVDSDDVDGEATMDQLGGELCDDDLSIEPLTALHRSSDAPAPSSSTNGTANPRAALLVCDVIDTGPGIPVAHADSVFHPFTRVDESSTRKSQGSGLGLSIAQQQAQRLGGDISLTSKIGEGSTFRLRIPIEIGTESTRFVLNPKDDSPVIKSATEVLHEKGLDQIVAIVIGDRDIWGNELSSKLRAHGVQTIYTPTDEAALSTATVCVSSSSDITLAIMRCESNPEDLVWLMLSRARVIDAQSTDQTSGPQSSLMDSFVSQFAAEVLARTSLYPSFLSLRGLISHGIWHEAKSLGIIDPMVAESALRRLGPVNRNKSNLSRNTSLNSNASSAGLSPVPSRALARTSASTITDQHGEEKEAPAAEQRKVRVAIVEDSKTNQMVLNRFLKGSPFISSVLIFDHGKAIVDAWEAALKEGQGPLVDVILMDLQMPVMDGLTATRHIRRLQREKGRAGTGAGGHPNPHIIAVSADVLAGVEETCAEAGLDYYIVKPVKKPLVLNSIEAIATRGCLPVYITRSIKDKSMARPAVVTEADVM